MKQVIQTYERRFEVRPPYFSSMPREDLALVVTIPAFKEPDILSTLCSLCACDAPIGAVELILVINAPEGASADLLEINRETRRRAIQWAESSMPDFMELLVIEENKLPKKWAGAGLARKVGMDEALRRWGLLGTDGPILCLDADCTVSSDYLAKAQQLFAHQKVKLGHFMFRHRWEEEKDTVLQHGILCYELHLRCFIQGLEWARYPFAVHTVGSCMAVRASAYARSGGMNRRKAGEDFYFMHKLLPLGGFCYINAVVFPSCRVSDRVPFGTGRAQLEWLASERQKNTYHPEIYKHLALVFAQVPEWYFQGVVSAKIPEALRSFFIHENLESQIGRLRDHSSSLEGFLGKFWQWMDGFMVLKMVHFLRDNGFPNQPLQEVASFFQEIPVGEWSRGIDPEIGKLLTCVNSITR